MDGAALDYEVKADALEAGFEAVEPGDDSRIVALEGELGALRQLVERQARLAGRPALASGIKSADDDGLRARFVNGYLRQGAMGLEMKSVVGTGNATGGYAIPKQIDEQIAATMKLISPIRAIANVVQVGTSGYRKLVTTGSTPSGWVAEDATRSLTDTPSFNEIAPPIGELYANPAASQVMLDDLAFDVEAWLADEIAQEFARAEGAAFISGNGTNRPKGFLASPVASTGDAVRAFGTLQYLASGTSAGFGTTGPEKLVDLVQSLKAPYRQGAVFVMNSATAGTIRKFKTTDGAFIWQPGLSQDRPDTLLGYPVIEAEDMPDLAADSLSIAFGNFKAGYLIADRRETTILRDPYSNKPYVQFYATKRVGGMVMNSNAIKLMKFGTA
jgi:HK97 family phage major capsid protein